MSLYWWHALAELAQLLMERDAREWEIETMHDFKYGLL